MNYLSLDFIQTVAFGGLVLFVGYGIRKVLPWLARYNVPAPVIGGLIVAVAMLIARSQNVELATFDTRLQIPMMIAFFTTVGFGASLSLLKVGGPQVMMFFLLSTVLAVLQNLVGIALGCADGWRVLHRLHKRAPHYRLPQHFELKPPASSTALESVQSRGLEKTGPT